MAFDFPASPSIDQDYVAGTVTYTYNGTGWVLKGTNAGQFVSKSGDTMTGNLTINNASAPTGVAALHLDRVGGADGRAVIGKTNGVMRWRADFGDAVAEGGSNTGANFTIHSYQDNGTYLFSPFQIERNTNNIKVNSTTSSTSPTTGALTVAGGMGVNGALIAAGPIGVGDVNPTANIHIKGSTTALLVKFENSTPTTGKTWHIGNVASDGSFRIAHTVVLDAIVINHTTGNVGVNSSTASSSHTTGALVVNGGVGINGAVFSSGWFSTLSSISVEGDIHLKNGRCIYWYDGPGTTSRPVLTGYNNELFFDNRYGGNINFRGGAVVGQTNGLMTLQSNGTLSVYGTAISTNTSTGALTVVGGTGIGGNLCIGGQTRFGNGTHPSLNLAVTMAFAGGGTQYGFGTRPAADGTYAYTCFNAADSLVGGVQSTVSATNFNTSSDIRLKDDLKSFDAGSIIDRLNVYDFKWKSTGERAYGVMAQEAIEVYPVPVFHEEMCDGWFIDYSKYVPLLLQELKSVRNRLQQLEDK